MAVPAALVLSCVALGFTALGLWVGQLASATGAHPLEVSGVGPQSTNLGAGNRALGEHGGCLSLFTVQGLRGEGHQRLRLLQRVL